MFTWHSSQKIRRWKEIATTIRIIYWMPTPKYYTLLIAVWLSQFVVIFSFGWRKRKIENHSMSIWMMIKNEIFFLPFQWILEQQQDSKKKKRKKYRIPVYCYFVIYTRAYVNVNCRILELFFRNYVKHRENVERD